MGLSTALSVSTAAPGGGEHIARPSYRCDGLAGSNLVVAALGCAVPPPILAELHLSPAALTLVTDAPSLRRACALLGPTAGILLYLADVQSVAELAPVLRRQHAVVAVCPAAGVSGRVKLMASGADCAFGSLCPDEALHLLSTLVRSCAGRVAEASGNAVLEVGRLTADRNGRWATVDGQAVRLTALEFDLLWYFMQHPGLALTRERLLSQVWGFDVGGLETVTVHIRRLRSKIEADPAKPILLETVWGVGYRLLPADTAGAASETTPPAQRLSGARG